MGTRRIGALLAALVAGLVVGTLPLGVPAPPAAAANGCEAMFPEATFENSAPIGAATLHTSELADTVAARVADDLRRAAELIAGDLPGLAGVEVCVFADELPLDAQALGWPEGQRLRAVSFGPERVVALSAWQLRLLADAGVLGLAHQAQWGVGDGHYPDPLGGAVAQWYAARLDDRLGRDHATMRYANLIRAIPEDIPWTAEAIPERLLWNPEFQLSPIGDFVEFAVAAEGTGVLREPDAATWRRLQADWQRSLLVEATGSESGTRGWIGGVVVVSIIAVMGLALALGAFVQHRRRQRSTVRVTIPVRDAPVNGPSD